MITALLVGLGGAAGALTRFGLDVWLEGQRERRRRHDRPPRAYLPVGTLMVNTAGSLIIGLAWGLLSTAGMDPDGYAAVAAGLAGGLTTFSTLSVATVSLWQGGRRVAAVVNLLANLTLGLAAAALGITVAAGV
ncbi:CrcB family protein [Arthrobacter sp. H5]|uniref:fluoride efflux transporter FluC n=1 Tax=Arthrobacter sp. H5 TaxID=1267973 RepID=UPI00048918B7|nr:CrcB family protein [Arthrobacter sp. H5]